MRRYLLRPYDGRVALLWPEDQPDPCPGDPTTGWSEIFPNLVIRRIAGDHVSCMLGHVEALGKAVRELLDDSSVAGRAQ